MFLFGSEVIMSIVVVHYLLCSTRTFTHAFNYFERSSSHNNCKLGFVYHDIGGISLGMFFVLHGALKLPAQFLPKIPPRMVRGKPTETENIRNNTFKGMHKLIHILKQVNHISYRQLVKFSSL